MYYKVVTEALLSAFVIGETAVQYKVGKPVYPLFGKLFVFDDLEHAKEFGSRRHWQYWTKLEIWECEITGPQPPPKYIPWQRNQRMADFWAAISRDVFSWETLLIHQTWMLKEDDNRFSCILPKPGTVCVESVTLTTRLFP